MQSELPVQFEVFPNKLGIVSFNKPKALNAANKTMNTAILQKLVEWERDGTQAILFTSTSERAFCSGGDVKALAQALQMDPQTKMPCETLAQEYRLICALARSPVESISLMDGVTMGFGLGLACRAKCRIATERSLIAMPENAIGLFPDVGFAFVVKHMPCEALYMGLTGARLGGKISPPADIVYLGLATHFVESDKLVAMIEVRV